MLSHVHANYITHFPIKRVSTKISLEILNFDQLENKFVRLITGSNNDLLESDIHTSLISKY